jgi:hypothetical protein
VTPVHLSPESVMWIVLVEEVVAALPEERGARIIDPIARCRDVVSRSIIQFRLGELELAHGVHTFGLRGNAI